MECSNATQWISGFKVLHAAIAKDIIIILYVLKIASLGPRNDRSGADIDILGPRNAIFGFDGAPERRSGAFRLTFTTG